MEPQVAASSEEDERQQVGSSDVGIFSILKKFAVPLYISGMKKLPVVSAILSECGYEATNWQSDDIEESDIFDD